MTQQAKALFEAVQHKLVPLKESVTIEWKQQEERWIPLYPAALDALILLIKQQPFYMDDYQEWLQQHSIDFSMTALEKEAPSADEKTLRAMLTALFNGEQRVEGVLAKALADGVIAKIICALEKRYTEESIEV